MTGKQRLTALLFNEPKDRMPWTTLVDDITRSVMPEDIRSMHVMDFYRYIGCDIFQFGNYGLKPEDAVKYSYKVLRKDIKDKWEWLDSQFLRHTIETPWGVLTGITRNNHPFKYPVETIEDLRILKKIWENTEYVLRTKGCEETYERIDMLIGDSGLYVPIVEPSALQTLLEEDVGIESSYYMLADYPDEVAELVELIHDRRKQQYRIIAEQMPYIGCISVENTSTSYISPDIYRQFSQRHMAGFVEIMHAHGKKRNFTYVRAGQQPAHGFYSNGA